MPRYFSLCLSLLILLGGVSYVTAQEDDSMFSARGRKDEPARNMEEALVKLRIEKEKKDFNEMLKRGEDAAKLANELKDSGTAEQRDEISTIGKLVNKIRTELGGEGDGESDSEKDLPPSEPGAIKSLKEEVNGLADDLKKGTRFTVSADAIDRTNTILRLIKYLHG